MYAEARLGTFVNLVIVGQEGYMRRNPASSSNSSTSTSSSNRRRRRGLIIMPRDNKIMYLNIRNILTFIAL